MTRLLVGVGHPDRGDDSVGPAVVEAARTQAPEGVEVHRVDDPSALLDLWAGAEVAVVVDAVVSGGAPGDVRILDATASPLPAGGWSAGGTHALGLAAAVELSRALGRLPGRLVIVGIEVAPTAQALEAGTGLSASVAAAVDTAALAAVRALG